MRMIHEHRVLTADQVTAMAFPSYRSGRQRLRELYLWNVLDRFQPFVTFGSAPMHYVLGPAGATALAAEEGLDRSHLGYRHDRALGVAHSLKLAHTVGVNEWFAALTASAVQDIRAGGGRGARLDVWWAEARCLRHFGDLARPDAYGRWTDGAHGTDRPTTIEFFLEYDFGTEPLARIADKLAGYAALATATAISTPLLVWLPTARREAGARTLLARAWRALPEPAAVPVATSAADLLDPDDPHAGPADAVWLPLHTPPYSTWTNRHRLADLLDVWPQLPPLLQPPSSGEQPATTSGPAHLPPVIPMPPATAR